MSMHIICVWVLAATHLQIFDVSDSTEETNKHAVAGPCFKQLDAHIVMNWSVVALLGGPYCSIYDDVSHIGAGSSFSFFFLCRPLFACLLTVRLAITSSDTLGFAPRPGSAVLTATTARSRSANIASNFKPILKQKFKKPSNIHIEKEKCDVGCKD